MAWSTRSKLFFLHSNSVAQNSLISEFRASNVRRVCLFKNTVPITFFSYNDSSPAPTHFLRFPPKPHNSALSCTSLFCKKNLNFTNHEKIADFITTALGNRNQCCGYKTNPQGLEVVCKTKRQFYF